jgi:hypothetical protein
MKGFGVFVDFASSTGNQTTTLWFESREGQSLKNVCCQALLQPILGIFLINGEELVVWNLIRTTNCGAGKITSATHVS